MSSNLPSDVFRYIQQEEVAGKSSFSEFLLQGLGGNNNYLKKTADDLQAQINSYYAAGALSMTGIFIPSYATPNLASPNGKPWFCAFIGPEFNGNVFYPWNVVIEGFTTYFNGSNSSLALARIQGNILLTSWLHEMTGIGFYYT